MRWAQDSKGHLELLWCGPSKASHLQRWQVKISMGLAQACMSLSCANW